MYQLKSPALAGVAVAVVVMACKGSDAQYSAGEVDKSVGKAAATIDSTSPPVPTTAMWSSAAIIGFAETANIGEVQVSRLAAKKGTNADVKAFARLMVRDHSSMEAATKGLATTLSIVADTATNDARDLASRERDGMKELTDKAAGADWDKDYMGMMVAGHLKVLTTLQDAEKSATDAHVRAALQSSIAKVQTHLTKAQEVRSKLQ